METRGWNKENQSLELFLSPDILGLVTLDLKISISYRLLILVQVDENRDCVSSPPSSLPFPSLCASALLVPLPHLLRTADGCTPRLQSCLCSQLTEEMQLDN